MEEFKDTVAEVLKGSDHLLIIGDLNIDNWDPNLPLSRPDIKALQPVYEKMLTKHGLERLDKEPTRHAPNNNSSLLDLVLSSDITNIYGITNLKTGLSDHDGILCKLRCKDLEIQPQFCILRSYKEVSAANILPEVDASQDLQSPFTDTDPDEIATKLNRSLNRIAEKLISKKKVQFKKENKRHDDEELRVARSNIKIQSKIAHTAKDDEEY